MPASIWATQVPGGGTITYSLVFNKIGAPLNKNTMYFPVIML